MCCTDRKYINPNYIKMSLVVQPPNSAEQRNGTRYGLDARIGLFDPPDFYPRTILLKGAARHPFAFFLTRNGFLIQYSRLK